MSTTPISPSLSLKRSRSDLGKRSGKKPRLEILSPIPENAPTALSHRSVSLGDLGGSKATGIYGNLMSTCPVTDVQKLAQPFKLSFCATSEKGQRPANEDHYVIFSMPFGDIFAVFDGHGDLDPTRLATGQDQIGKELAKQAAQLLEARLPVFIQNCNYNILRAFKRWCRECQHALPTVRAGTTAVFCLFEKLNHSLHTATVGDSRAFLFRKKNETISAIALSPDAHWCTPEAEMRVQQILEPAEFEKWKAETQPKKRRFPPSKGINIASSLGDKYMYINGKTAISHAPDYNQTKTNHDDIIVIACDGVWDYVDADTLIKDVIQPHWGDLQVNLSKAISNFAFEAQRSKTQDFQSSSKGDNITAIAVRVGHPQPENFALTQEEVSTQPFDSSEE
jgi:serine/threonine protein phosphatase PrpC